MSGAGVCATRAPPWIPHRGAVRRLRGGGFRWGLATGVGLGMRVVVVAAPCPWVPAFAGTTVKVREGVGGGGRLWGLPRLGHWVPAYAGTTVWRYGVGVRGYVEWVCSWGGAAFAPPWVPHRGAVRRMGVGLLAVVRGGGASVSPPGPLGTGLRRHDEGCGGSRVTSSAVGPGRCERRSITGPL